MPEEQLTIQRFEIATAEEAPSGLSLLQHGVLSLLSGGKTHKQVSRRLDITRRELLTAERAAIDYFDAINTADAVSKAICAEELEIVLQPDPAIERKLTSDDRILLGFYACGGTDSRIVQTERITLKSVYAYREDVFKKIGAWSTPHAVRRSYELELF